jgi:hypothetical protein
MDILMLSCVYIATKYNENFPFRLNILDLLTFSKCQTINVSDITSIEQQITSNILQYNLHYLTPIDIVEMILVKVFSKYTTLKQVYQEIAFHIEYCILDKDMSKFSNLSIAFASILVVF